MVEEKVFAEALLSAGASSEIPAADQIFAPFIGSWDLIVRWFDADGNVTRDESGEWHFAWVLEGRGIQDVWIVPPRKARDTAAVNYEYGTSIRFYDAETRVWQSTWIGPMHNMVRTFAARRIDDRIVLETTPGALPKMRWSFSDVAANSFRWANEVHEDGKWRLQQTFEARRMSGQ